MTKDISQGVRHIITRIEQRPANPVTRARIMVEREVPEAQRGPGWDRHWRELEAYLESPGIWNGVKDGQEESDPFA